MYKCKNCKAEISDEVFERTEDNPEKGFQDDEHFNCGCFKYDEDYGAECCNCKFEKVK